MSKNLDETVRLRSEKKRRADTTDMRRETGDWWRAQVAFPVWPAHRPRRSPGEASVRGPIVV